jgi:plasmid stabilization system protein ParE
LKPVRFSRRAQADLVAIGNWIARDNPRRAVSFVHAMRRACELIGDNPAMYELVEGTTSGTRRMVFAPYVIFYRDLPNHIMIGRVQHGAQVKR